ncbi:hypothetical protein EXU57_22355 [Segetibacter sp. 3557_3]|uniref:hypothetical protein n=1 Tax=Segetibacter sp. 3557_3 TaxID=2547429 RepID=UPI0010587024|nr:hypothetical protein [Segetibacter sp. 3557_3]TDH19804.1 hypothetical protein EXU57_22355 [Segetibacter sp. 3557_3]
MRKDTIIRSIAAIFLLIVFACGITPKKTMHDLVASHKDSTMEIGQCHADHLSVAGLNCKCDNLVSESVYLYTLIEACAPLPQVFSTEASIADVTYPTTYYWYNELRGPPACC